MDQERMELINRDTFLKNMRPVIASEKDGSIMIDRISFNSPTGRWYNLRAVKKRWYEKRQTDLCQAL